MTKIVVVYYSGFGHTEKVAEAVARGAESAGDMEVRLVSVDDIRDHWDDLDDSDGIIFGSPTYMGSLSASFKAFMEETSKTWYAQKWKDKIAGGFTNSAFWSGDKVIALTQLVVFASQHGMIWVSNDLLPNYNESEPSADTMNRLGIWLGAGTQSNAEEDPETAPPPSDLRTAEYYGKRVALAAKRWNFARERSGG